MASADDLARQNELLRVRIAQLERAVAGQVDPVLLALLEHAPAFLNVVTPDGRFLATGRVSEGFGSVVGRSVFEFTEPDQHPVIRAALAEACETARPVVYEIVAFSESGEPGHTHVVRAIPVIEAGAVKALVLVPTDITERVRLERSLIESEHALRLAVDATRMGLWRWDIPRNLVQWDARMLEIFGIASAPQDYESYLRCLHPDDRVRVGSVVREAQETGSYPTFEHRLITPSGGERWVLAVGKVIKDGAGRVLLMLGGALEITEQKRLATQMLRAERVEALGQLTAGIAHNFNNLLAVILPNVELSLLDAPQALRGSLSSAFDAALQARDLVKSLLSLARRRSGNADGPSDPKQVVARLDAICQLTFPKEVELQTVVEGPTSLLAMPVSDLEQVLLNLLFNARDAVMDRAGGLRQIRLLLDRIVNSAGVAQTRIRVVDSGVGMTDAVKKQVFDPFFTTKPPHRGSGLGLANVWSRVREADAQIECASEPGHGTTFTLLLPEVAAAPMSPVPSPEGGSARGGETILLVDDEPMVRAVIRRVLGSQGYKTLEAGSAAEARDVLREHGGCVQLVLLDQSMPVESGIEALPSLRALCSAPVVLFTGLATEVPPGIVELVEKPVRPAELLSVVRRLLDA